MPCGHPTLPTPLIRLVCAAAGAHSPINRGQSSLEVPAMSAPPPNHQPGAGGRFASSRSSFCALCLGGSSGPDPRRPLPGGGADGALALAKIRAAPDALALLITDHLRPKTHRAAQGSHWAHLDPRLALRHPAHRTRRHRPAPQVEKLRSRRDVQQPSAATGERDQKIDPLGNGPAEISTTPRRLPRSIAVRIATVLRVSPSASAP